MNQISVFRAWWPLREFSRSKFLGVGPFFFVHKSFNSGAKGIHKWVQLPLFRRCASRYSGLNSFHRRLFAVERSFLLP